MSTADTAVTRFSEGFNCAQSVFAAFSEELGIDAETAVRIAGPFGGGMGCTAETCGAVTGALMVLGLRHTQPVAGKEAKQAIYAIASDFMARFKERSGALLCRDLLGYDISTAGGMAQARESGVMQSVCPRVVRDAAEILDAMGET